MSAAEPNSRRRPSWLLPTPARVDEKAADSPVRALLVRLMRGEDLSREDAARLFGAAMDECASDAQIGAALVALAVKGETVDELTGMAEAMRSRAGRIRCRHSRFIDTAGTGSSYAKTFNVSTAAAFVCAGAGLPVAKHGSRAATRLSGSADVLAELGVRVEAERKLSEECLNEEGICFLFAPLYHQATRRVATIRRQLGVHTTFNLLGPLTNPAGAPCQVIGVWHESLLEPLAHTLVALGSERAWVVHGLDGMDEVTTTASTTVAEASDGLVRTFTIKPEDFGLPRASDLQQLRGGNAKSNAALIRAVFASESGTKIALARDLAVANAAAALFVGGLENDLRTAAERARESILSGAALKKLNALAERTSAAVASA
ncbi:MAG: anthranilate phosphoribosyltransferase [Verrucomicrobia bacterium]|nr:anthranilate phosphoribosyltransferase [Verrucomicrobiota bacterium]